MTTKLLLILVATVLLCPATISTATTAVLDIDGQPLEAKTKYYILPVIRGRGGGLTLVAKNDTALCPLYVGQERLEVSEGLPVKLFPVNPNEKTISVSGDINAVFDAASICVVSTMWRLTTEEGTRVVGIGGVVGKPGVQTLSNWFRIDKAAGSGKFDYKIVFCPGVCSVCRVFCGELGVFVENDGRRLLGISDQPLIVMFKKA